MRQRSIAKQAPLSNLNDEHEHGDECLAHRYDFPTLDRFTLDILAMHTCRLQKTDFETEHEHRGSGGSMAKHDLPF